MPLFVSPAPLDDTGSETAANTMRQKFAEYVPQAAGWLDGDGRVVACNAEFRTLLGFAPGETPAFLDFMADGAYPWLRDTSAQLDPVRRTECELRTRQGKSVPAALGIRRVQETTGAFDLLLIENLTERRKIPRHVGSDRQFESVGVLAGGIAHEFNNALSPIALGLDLLRANSNGTDLRIIDQMTACAERAAGLVTQMLLFAKRLEIHPVLLEVAPLLADLERMIRTVVPDSIIIDITAQAGLPAVFGDRAMLGRALANLALNARDAMPLGGRLAIRAEAVMVTHRTDGTIGAVRPGSYVQFSVSDTGCGIAADVRARIFDPFFTTKAPNEGPGLGLSAVLGIVERHAGFIRLESEPGRGSKFEIYIPPAPPPTSPEGIHPGIPGPRIT